MLSRQIVQKRRERFYATEAAVRLGENWILSDRESPDFLVDDGGQIFGLEVTDCHIGTKSKGGSKLRSAESSNEKWLNGIREEFGSHTAAEIHLRYLGKATATSRRSLLDALQASNFEETPDFERVHKRIEGGQFWAFKCPYPSWVFMEDRVGWVSTDASYLQREIDAKANNLDRYREACASVRLLVVADRIFNSGKLEIASDFEPQLRGFEAVYFFPYPLALHAFSASKPKQI